MEVCRIPILILLAALFIGNADVANAQRFITGVVGDSMPAASHVRIKVYDDFGQEIKTVRNNDVVAWMDTIQWSGRNSRNARDGNAVYFLSMVSGNKIVANESISFDNSASQGSVHASAIIHFNYTLIRNIINSNK